MEIRKQRNITLYKEYKGMFMTNNASVTFALRLGYGGSTPPKSKDTCGGRRGSAVVSGSPYGDRYLLQAVEVALEL